MNKYKSWFSAISVAVALLSASGSAFTWYMSRQDRLDGRYASPEQVKSLQDALNGTKGTIIIHDGKISMLETDIAVVKNQNQVSIADRVNIHTKIDALEAKIDTRADKTDSKIDRLNDKIDRVLFKNSEK